MAIALDRPTLLTPGLKPVDPGFESWWVRPGGATVVRVRPGDRLTVRDPDGGQPAEVDRARRRGHGRRGRARCPRRRARERADRGPRQRRRSRRSWASCTAAASRRMTRARSACSRPTRRPARRSPSPPRAPRPWSSARPAAASSRAGGRRRALVVEIHRAEPPTTAGEIELPAPLAEPRLDFRVDRASALSYEVREGEYIQIIDVAAASARTSSPSTRRSCSRASSAASTPRSRAR